MDISNEMAKFEKRDRRRKVIIEYENKKLAAEGLRKDLLDSMLGHRVLYLYGVRKHGLTNEEHDYLFARDNVVRREYVEWVKDQGGSCRTAYRKFEQKCSEYLKLSYKALQEVIQEAGSSSPYHRIKLKPDRVREYFDLSNGIPANFIFADRREYIFFLEKVRDKFHRERKEDISTKAVAQKLGFTPQHVLRLAKKGKFTRLGHDRIMPGSLYLWVSAHKKKAKAKAEMAARRVIEEAKIAFNAFSILNEFERILGEEETKPSIALGRVIALVKREIKGNLL